MEFTGGYLLARGFLRSVSLEAALGFMGFNPFQVRNFIRSHYEAVAGFTWFFLGLVTTLIGTIRSVRFGQQGSLRSSLYVVVVFVIVGVALLRLTVRWTDALSRAKYVPIICQQQREVYRLSLHALAHDGEYPQDGPNTGLQRHDRDNRLNNATEVLDRLALLLDEPRQSDETDSALAERLRRRYFS